MERTTQLVGQASSFLDAVERASRAAPLDRPVLVIGERGTGKELIAERLHHLSRRWDGPLVVMNCAALPESLIEAELFGHEAGAFTGATKTRAGRFEEADGGTLFLDELATLSSAAQDRLLRAVEYGEITRIGASKPVLRRRGKRRQLVEEQGAPIGLLEAAGPGLGRACEGPRLVSEELRLDQRFRQCGAIHHHQGAVPTTGKVVQPLGDQLLAGAALAEGQADSLARGP